MRKYNEYTVYFEVYGKKLKTKVMAFSNDSAIALVKARTLEKLKILKVEENPTVKDEIYKFLKGFAK
jgi:SHS2 domain-containing protein